MHVRRFYFKSAPRTFPTKHAVEHYRKPTFLIIYKNIFIIIFFLIFIFNFFSIGGIIIIILLLKCGLCLVQTPRLAVSALYRM